MFFAGMAAGINRESAAARAEEAEKAARQSDRENRILEHLSTSDDPEIASMALSGLLHQATGKPAKGLRGWMGEIERNPTLPTIRQLMGSAKQSNVTTEPAPGRLPEGTSAAMPAGSAVEPGGPPMSLEAVHNTLPQAPGASTTIRTPRKAFLTPTERVRANEEAQIGGKLSAFRSGLAGATTPQERQVVMGAAGVRMPVTGQFMGNTQRDGQWYRQERLFNQDSGAFEIQEIPIAAPASQQVKPTYQTLAGPGGEPHVYRILPDGTKTDLGAKAVKDGLIDGVDPETQEHYSIRVPATFSSPNARGGGSTPPPPAGGVAAGTARGAQAGAPPPAPAGRATGQPAAGTAPAGGAASASAVGTPPPSASSLPRGAISRGRAKALTPTEGAMLGPDGTAQVTTALYDKGTGKYYDPANPKAEFAGFIPGKEGVESVKVIANTHAVENTIDRAIAAIEGLGLLEDDDPATTANLALQYRSGKAGTDPLVPAFNALNDFVKIQGASQFVAGTRSFDYITQIQQHLPLLPSTRAAVASNATGGMVGPITAQVLGGEGAGHQWDSPKQMVEKLRLAKQNLSAIRDERMKASGKVPERAIGAGGAPPAAGAAKPAATPPPGPSPNDVSIHGGANPAAATGTAKPAAPAMIQARDPQGKLHQAPAGTPLPAEWTLEPVKR